MSRTEQIKEAALKECSSFSIPDKQVRFKGVNSAYGLGFCEGAMWADANPYINWQQVRIQAAIAAMKGICSNSSSFATMNKQVIVKESIGIADAFVKSMKGE